MTPTHDCAMGNPIREQTIIVTVRCFPTVKRSVNGIIIGPDFDRYFTARPWITGRNKADHSAMTLGTAQSLKLYTMPKH